VKKFMLTTLAMVMLFCFATSLAATSNSNLVVYFSPGYEPNIKVNSDFFFSLTTNVANNTGLNFSWFLDDVEVSTADNYTLNVNSTGVHNLTAIISDNSSNISNTWQVSIVDKPVANTFDNNLTTNFSAISDIANVSNLSVGNSNGSIVFTENVDLSNSIDFDNAVEISNGLISVDTNILPGLAGKSAKLRMIDVGSSSKPEIRVTFENGTVNDDCEALGLCKNVSFNKLVFQNGSSNVLEFDVDHFTTFEVVTAQEPGIVTVTKPVVQSKLVIDRIRIKKDGKKRTSFDGDTVDNIKPGTDLQVEVEVRNIGNLEIHDVEVDGEIDEIDDGEKLDDVSSEFDLRAGEDDKVTLDFTIPYNADSVVYPLKLFVEGQDSQGNNHKVNATVFLRIEKKSHELAVSKLTVNNPVVECNRRLEVSIQVNNIGDNDEDDVKITVTNEALALNIKENVKLDEGSANDDDDSYFRRTYLVNVPNELERGEYKIRVEAFYDDKLSDDKEIDVFIDKCIEKKLPAVVEQENKDSTVDIVFAREVVPVGTPVVKQDEGFMIALMISAIVILIGLVAFAAMVVVLKK
jgi:hypothetical protein